MTTQSLTRAAVLALSLAWAAGAVAAEPVRCMTDKLGAETCRYADGTTTRRSSDRLGYETFRDRDGTTTRRKVDDSANAVVVTTRGKTVARCHDDGKGHALCRH